MIPLVCPVRSCTAPLQRVERTLSCERGHSFDVSRGGYVNLLQPRDKRSSRPGDTRDAALARRRMFERGWGWGALDAIETIVRERVAGRAPALLDLGCGEGSHLGALVERLGGEGCGVDISTPAIDLAARRYSSLSWVVANVDRFVPVATDSIDVAVSITSRLNPEDVARVLRVAGIAIVAVPAPDDLRELRELVLGKASSRDRVRRVAEAMSERFALIERRRASDSMKLDADGVRDLLLATYRGQRYSQRARAEVGGMIVTSSFDILAFEITRTT